MDGDEEIGCVAEEGEVGRNMRILKSPLMGRRRTHQGSLRKSRPSRSHHILLLRFSLSLRHIPYIRYPFPKARSSRLGHPTCPKRALRNPRQPTTLPIHSGHHVEFRHSQIGEREQLGAVPPGRIGEGRVHWQKAFVEWKRHEEDKYVANMSIPICWPRSTKLCVPLPAAIF